MPLHFPLMRLLPAAFGVLIVVPTAAAAGQVHVHVDIGPLITSPLVHDSIVAPLTIGTNPALAGGVRVTTVLSDPWRMGVLGRVARSDLELREAGTESRITAVTVWHLGATLGRQLTSRATAAATVGFLVYRAASRQANLFQDGEPRPLVWGLGAQYELPVSERVWIGLQLTYDGHRFGTSSLRLTGFREDRYVHRVYVGMTLGWHGEAPEQP